GGGRRWAGAEPARSQRRLHDLLPADDTRGAGIDRVGCPDRARRDSAICHSGARLLRRRSGAIHAEDRRDTRRARETDVPRARADSRRTAAQTYSPGEDRAARHGACAPRPGPAVAAATRGEPAVVSAQEPGRASSVARLRGVGLQYGDKSALDGIDLDIP